MNVDGTEQINLTNNPAYNDCPSFSTDGSKIAFNSYRDGNDEIYIMNVNGTEQIRLTNNQATDWGPSFSPSETATVEITIPETDATAITTASETTQQQETTPQTTEQKPSGPSKKTYLNNIANIINEYSMAINHWNTYQQNYTDIESYIAFDMTFLNKIGEINNMLKAVVPASGYESAQAHFIDLANQMYSFNQQEIQYLKNRNIDAANNMVNNFNNTWTEFKNYYNSL